MHHQQEHGYVLHGPGTIRHQWQLARSRRDQFCRGGAGDGGGKEGKPICYLKYLLERCFIKSWSISGDADDRPTEEVAFYYNQIAFCYASTRDGKKWESDAVPMEWDNTTQTTWSSGLKFNKDGAPAGWAAPPSKKS